MSEKRFQAIDTSQFETEADSTKIRILRDDDQYLVVKSVLASEIVQPYRDAQGKTVMAYKPADELEKATLTFRGVPIKALEHPKGSHIEDAADANGRVENPMFRKDLMDPKTKRPCRRGIDAELWFYRDGCVEAKSGNFTPITDAIAQSIRDGTLKDNSIGFSCFNYPTPGEWQGQHYDVVQRRIFGNHLAAPIERGRCPSPYCGINMDTEETPKPVTLADVTEEKDKAWIAKHQTIATDCPICLKIDELGVSEASKRLIKAYGAADTLLVLQDAKTSEEIEAERVAREEEEKKKKKPIPEDEVISKNKEAITALDSVLDIFA